MASLAGVLISLLCLQTTLLTSCSLYDPHLYPEHGPFFEGWYVRFTDSAQKRTFGFLFGKVLPQDEKSASKLAFMGLIYDDQSTSSLTSYNVFPPLALLNITTRGGHTVSKNPDISSPADFRWDAGLNYGYIEVKEDRTIINVTIDKVKFEAQIGAPVPWDNKREGPMGWLLNLPLTPLYWFVYSTRSPLLHYRWHHLDTGDIIQGTSGLVHMEKNWGKSFPAKWIWTQGVKSDNVSYAMAFGPINFGPVTLKGYLGGYKNPNKDIEIGFRPDNCHFTQNIDACSGAVQVTVNTLSYKVDFSIAAKRTTFSCLYGPMEDGFRKVCSESFKAVTVVNVYKRGWFGRLEKVDTQMIPMSALEFGGNFMCKGMC